jgi:mannose-6-phosphate isomerase-like protein (cupin superfamily)
LSCHWAREAKLFQSKQRFSFGTVPLNRSIAHGGRGYVLAKRVLTHDDLGVNHLDMVIVPPGSEIGLHTHAYTNQEIYIFISGEGLMCLDDQVFPVFSGDIVVNRPGGTHSLQNTGSEEILLVVVEVPEPHAVVANSPEHNQTTQDLT